MITEFHPQASLEMAEGAAHYESKLIGLGERFLLEVNRVTALLEEHPTIGPKVLRNFRCITLAGFPYSLIYTIEKQSVFIISVAHQRRRPYFWKERIDR